MKRFKADKWEEIRGFVKEKTLEEHTRLVMLYRRGLYIFGPTPTGRIRTYKFSLASPCLPALVFLQNRTLEWSIFWSLDQLGVETLGVASVRTSVRTVVRTSRCFSETAHYFFLKLYS